MDDKVAAVKHMMSSMKTTRVGLVTAIAARKRREEKSAAAAAKASAKAKAKASAEAARQESRRTANATAAGAARVSSKPSETWGVFNLGSELVGIDQLPQFAEMPTDVFDDTKPFVCEAGPQWNEVPEKDKLKRCASAWGMEYKKKNPKYDQIGRTFHELLPAQGAVAAKELFEKFLSKFPSERVMHASVSSAPALYGYSEVLQHFGTEYAQAATLKLHLSGEYDVVIMPVSILPKTLELTQLEDWVKKFDKKDLKVANAAGHKIYKGKAPASMECHVM